MYIDMNMYMYMYMYIPPTTGTVKGPIYSFQTSECITGSKSGSPRSVDPQTVDPQAVDPQPVST